MDAAVVERFWAKVIKSGGCWEWTAGHDKDGYAKFWWDGSSKPAHRFSYLIAHGDIPQGLQLDHLCRNRGCVNPDHLEPVTCRENLLRGDTWQAANAAKTHCPQGHPYDEANTFYSSGTGRRCRQCHREQSKRSMQKWRDRNREA